MATNFQIKLQGTADTKQWVEAQGVLRNLDTQAKQFIDSLRAGVGIDLGGKLVNSLAALPNVFVGLFMGLGASFSVLIVAEMVGVKSGIGFYLQWAQGWAAYPNMYAALLVMAFLCSGLISGLFMVRDRLLKWQRGGMTW